MSTKAGVYVQSKRTGQVLKAIPVVVGFSNKKLDMYRLYDTDGSFTSVDRDSIRRRYSVQWG